MSARGPEHFHRSSHHSTLQNNFEHAVETVDYPYLADLTPLSPLRCSVANSCDTATSRASTERRHDARARSLGCRAA